MLDQDQDYELASILLGHFAFTDREAILFGLRLLRFDSPDLPLLVTSLKSMLKIMESPSSVISHDNYLALVHTLLTKISENQTNSNLFWSLMTLTTDVLLLYKFGECETYLLDSFLATNDVCSLYVLARVFYDYASDLVERHQVLKKALNDDSVMQSPAFWGLLATISLSKAGKKAIEGIGSVEQLAYELMDADISE